jgi:hypothetical protein
LVPLKRSHVSAKELGHAWNTFVVASWLNPWVRSPQQVRQTIDNFVRFTPRGLRKRGPTGFTGRAALFQTLLSAPEGQYKSADPDAIPILQKILFSRLCSCVVQKGPIGAPGINKDTSLFLAANFRMSRRDDAPRVAERDIT